MTSADRVDALRPGGRPLRAVRSVAAALVCVTAAAVGHHSAGGALPSGAVLAAFTGTAVVAWLLSARRITPTQLLGLLVLCQVGVHLATSTSEMAMGAQMVVAHVGATVVSVVLLARGERFVWRLAERLALRVAPLLRLASVVPSSRPSPAVVVPRTRHDLLLAHARWLRGPPVGPA